jgi:hypothetical protein
MSDPSLAPENTPAEHRLTERVIARIKVAHRNVPGRPAGRRARRVTDSDARALRRVFRDFGKSYRDYRRRTGEPVSSDVREAAVRFRQEPNLGSLVAVAAQLDRVDHDLVG